MRHTPLLLKCEQSLKSKNKLKTRSSTLQEAGTSLDLNGDTSYFGIMGKTKADSAAKSALDLPRVTVGVTYSDFKHHNRQYFLST